MDSFLFGIIVLAIYFLPSIIGYNHSNSTSIFLLNLFLGWTFIGWVVAIIWANSNDKPNKRIVIDNKKSVSEQLTLLKGLYEDGTLTKDEFDKEKTSLLRR